MLRLLIYGLTVLHLGPGFAFAVLAFGCDDSQPALGALCRQDSLATFLWLTVGIWVLCGLGLGIRYVLQQRRTRAI